MEFTNAHAITAVIIVAQAAAAKRLSLAVGVFMAFILELSVVGDPNQPHQDPRQGDVVDAAGFLTGDARFRVNSDQSADVLNSAST